MLIKLELNDDEIEVTVQEARSLYNQLKELFEEQVTYPDYIPPIPYQPNRPYYVPVLSQFYYTTSYDGVDK